MISNFIKIRRVLRSAETHRIYSIIKSAFVRERIHDTRQKLANNNKELITTRLQVSNNTRNEDWELWTEIPSTL